MDIYIAGNTWGSIGSALKKKIGGSLSAVEICHNGIYHRYEGKERLEAGLNIALLDRLKLTKGTPMRSGQLHQDFRLLGNIAVASRVLKGTYVSPEG